MKRSKRMMDDLDQDIRDFIERETQDNIERGMPPDEARYAALRKFGNVTRIKEDAREVWMFAWSEQLRQDIRYGLRAMRHSPGFTAVAVLSLALGIGANTAIFSLIDAVMLRNLPVSDPQRLVALDWASKGLPDVIEGIAGIWYQDKTGRTTSPSFTYPLYEAIRTRSHVFSNVLAMAGNASDLNVGFRGEPGRADGELVSGTFFDTLGVQPALGRMLTPDDDRVESASAAVISYGYWDRRFGHDAAIIGKTITLNSVPFTVVGVCPPEFFGVQPGRAVDVWVPQHQQPRVEPRWSQHAEQGTIFADTKGWWVVIVARLKPGVSKQQARAEAELMLQQSIAPDVKAGTKPETLPHVELSSGKGLDNLRREFSRPLAILMTVVGLVLLIACANVANLLLTRGASRRREMAVRLAIGAGRSRLIRQLLTESVLLAGLGGALGLVLAFWSTSLLVAFMSSGADPLNLSVKPDPWVLGFTAAVSIVTGTLFGLSPALRSTRVDLTPALKESGGREQGIDTGQRARRMGIGRSLVIAQVSLSLLLLVGAGLFVRTLTNLENVNAGFNERNLLLFGIDPTQDGYKGQRLAQFYQELTRRVAAEPGVRSVSLSTATLIGGGMSMNEAYMEGTPPKEANKDGAVSVHFNAVGANFFETLGIPLVLGRTINDGDVGETPKVAVVNEQFARKFLSGSSPVGRRFGLDKKNKGAVQIVGVVAGAKYADLRRDIPPTVYPAALQDTHGLGPIHFEVRTYGDPDQMIPAMRRAAQSMDSNLALYDVRSQVEQIDQTLFQERLFARLTAFFGILALTLGCIGVYGVMAFAVTRRTREIGIRVALGASRSGILGMVLRETLVLVAVGITLGVIAALEATRLVSSLLFGLKSNDPLTIAGAALLMVAAAAFAGYLPARRASRVDPMVALRYE